MPRVHYPKGRRAARASVAKWDSGLRYDSHLSSPTVCLWALVKSLHAVKPGHYTCLPKKAHHCGSRSTRDAGGALQTQTEAESLAQTDSFETPALTDTWVNIQAGQCTATCSPVQGLQSKGFINL